MSQTSSSLLKTIDARFQPLSGRLHAHWGLRAFSDVGFAAGIDTVPLGMSEIQSVAATLPMMFEPDGMMLRPVALLRPRLPDGRVLPQIDPQGRYLGVYMPALLRLHPFALRTAPWTGPGADPEAVQAGGTRRDSALLCFDPESPWLIRDLASTRAQAGAERLFDVNGMPSPLLSRICTFFDRFRPGYTRAAVAATALHRAGLLRPADMIAPEGQGLLTVDRAALDRFCGATAEGPVENAAAIAALVQKGALELAHAQITSLLRVSHLERTRIAWHAEEAEEEGRRGAAEARGRRPAPEADAAPAPSLAGFMDAMADSYNRPRDDYFDDEGA